MVIKERKQAQRHPWEGLHKYTKVIQHEHWFFGFTNKTIEWLLILLGFFSNPAICLAISIYTLVVASLSTLANRKQPHQTWAFFRVWPKNPVISGQKNATMGELAWDSACRLLFFSYKTKNIFWVEPRARKK